MKIVLLLLVTTFIASAQRITTIQLDGVQYFVSRMNPYSPELNYFLAYQYCRSLGLQLASFESKEKADTMTQYLKNAGYTKYDFWTSGNKLGTDMFLWMSTGLPFNATFDYMLRRSRNQGVDVPPGTEPQRVARESGDSGSADGCVAMTAPSLAWDAQDCTLVKDFICEQTRCYYYNYGSIPVSATQGNRRPYATMTTTTALPEYNRDENSNAAVGATAVTAEAAMVTMDKEIGTTQETNEKINEEEAVDQGTNHHDENETLQEQEVQKENDDNISPSFNEETHSIPNDPVVGRLINTLVTDSSSSLLSLPSLSTVKTKDEAIKVEKSRTEDIPDITSLFGNPAIKTRTATVFDGLETHDIRSLQRANQQSKNPEKLMSKLKHENDNENEESKTIGPYDSVQDYVNDESVSGVASEITNIKDHDDDSSTPYPDAEPAYRYNIKVRTNGKVLDPPSK